jgi:hypothetical protein
MIKDDENKKICVICNKEKSITSFAVNGRNNYRRKQCKVCVSQKLKIIKTPTLNTKVCNACNIEKEIKQFTRQQGIGDGYAARCKKCKLDGILMPREKKERKEIRPLTLAAPSIQDYKDMYKLMETIGYLLSEDLHIQFCNKYGLTPNIPKKVFLSHYSQKDCGLV